MVPKMLRISRVGRLFFGREISFPERRSMITATTAATIFLKKAFCIVGTSPASRTKTDIAEKKKAASRIKRIPFLLSFVFFDPPPAAALLFIVFPSYCISSGNAAMDRASPLAMGHGHFAESQKPGS